MPRAYLMGLREEISHLDWRNALNHSFSAGVEAMEMMSSTWTTKIMVPVGDW